MAEQDKNVNQTPAQGKTDKPAKKKDAQPNAVVRFFRRIGKWLRDLKSEAKKVVLADRQTGLQQHGGRHRVHYRCGHFCRAFGHGIRLYPRAYRRSGLTARRTGGYYV